MADNFYSDYIKSLKEDFPNAERAFAYFCEQSNYSSMEEFLEDYGYSKEDRRLGNNSAL